MTDTSLPRTDTGAPAFAELGTPPALVQALTDEGFERPFAIQVTAIPPALEGKDVLGQARTGSGKTLAFGIPMLARLSHAVPHKPTGVVLVPTRELCSQVAEVLAPLGHALHRRVVPLYGGVPLDKHKRQLNEGIDLAVITPGRAIDLVQRKDLDLSAVEIVTVDEADRMADMGFLPQVDWLVRHMPKQRQTLLFSATLEGDAGRLSRSWTQDAVRIGVDDARGDHQVPTMDHRFLAVYGADKARLVTRLVKAEGRAIVFCNTKRMVDRVVRALQDEGTHAAAIHGDLPQRLREKALAGFAEGSVSALVATGVAARGLDIDDVPLVVHWEPAQDAKEYQHRSGRTARAGASGMVVTLVEWNQMTQARILQRGNGISTPVVEMLSNDPRLDDLGAFDPTGSADGFVPRTKR
jgi:superfamily II DNA/RNA helicase